MIRLYHAKINDVWFAVAMENEKIVATAFSFSRKEALEHLLRNLPYDVPFQLEEKLSPTAERVLGCLRDVFDGKDVSFNLSLATHHLTPYAKRVLETLRSVPTGYVTTYKELAKVAGGSPRAVGRVMASNPFVLLVPCHRVVKSDLSLGGFGYGVKIKWEILQREDRRYKEPLRIALNGKTLTAYPVRLIKMP